MLRLHVKTNSVVNIPSAPGVHGKVELGVVIITTQERTNSTVPEYI